MSQKAVPTDFAVWNDGHVECDTQEFGTKEEQTTERTDTSTVSTDAAGSMHAATAVLSSRPIILQDTSPGTPTRGRDVDEGMQPEQRGTVRRSQRKGQPPVRYGDYVYSTDYWKCVFSFMRHLILSFNFTVYVGEECYVYFNVNYPPGTSKYIEVHQDLKTNQYQIESGHVKRCWS